MLTPAVLALAARGVRLTEVISEERKGALCNTGLRVPGSPIAPFCCFGSQRQAVGPRGRRSWSPSRFLSTAAVPRASDLEMLPGPSSKVALRIRTPGTTTITSTINLSQQSCGQTTLARHRSRSELGHGRGSVRYDDVCVCVCVCVCIAHISPTKGPSGMDYNIFKYYSLCTSISQGVPELKTFGAVRPNSPSLE